MNVNESHDITIYWNNFVAGEKHTFGKYYLSTKKIIEFGLDYDPLPHHISEETAKHSPIGKLCASGIQGVGIAHKILCDNFLKKTSLYAGKGFEEMIVHQPILPEQNLHIEMSILETTPHKYKNDRGWVHYKVVLFGENDEKLLSYRAMVLFLCNPDLINN